MYIKTKIISIKSNIYVYPVIMMWYYLGSLGGFAIVSLTQILTQGEENQVNTLPYGITISKDQHSQTVYLSGEIDFSASLTLEPILDQIANSCTGELLIDLERVEFIDSEGIKLLITTFAKAQERGVKVKVIRYSDRALRTIELAGVYELFNTCSLFRPIE